VTPGAEPGPHGATPKLKLLVIDDEPAVVNALSRTLRGLYDVRTGTSAAEGLAVLGREPAVAIVLSDMRMPGMNGATFLFEARKMAPETVRVLLTGQADMDDVVHAINEGNIYRFLRKPCSPDLMRATLLAAAEQHRLVVAERQLLEQTLRGSVQALADALALSSPTVFGASVRVKETCTKLASKIGLKVTWSLEVAATMSHIGAISLPHGLYERRSKKMMLTVHEKAMLDRISTVTAQLLAPIPRLEQVREIIQRAGPTPAAPIASKPEDVAVQAGHSLRVALDFEELECELSTTGALHRIRHAPHGVYDPNVVDALVEIHASQATMTTIDVPIKGVSVGMVIAADVFSRSGVLIVARGHRVTESVMERLRNFITTIEKETIQVTAAVEPVELAS